jgi:hypothetical protein
VINIFGSNATLDAGQKGRFFNGDGSKGRTSLELHDITLQNGKVDVSRSGEVVLASFLSIFHPFSSISDEEIFSVDSANRVDR